MLLKFMTTFLFERENFLILKILILGVTLVFFLKSPVDAENFRAIKLIGDLNDNVSANAKARQELVEMGDKAVGEILAEIEKYTVATKEAELSAARCFRVLSEMQSEKADTLAREIIALLNPGAKRQSTKRVLLSETLKYLVTLNNSTENIQALYNFIANSPEKWRRSNYSFFSTTYSRATGTSYNKHWTHHTTELTNKIYPFGKMSSGSSSSTWEKTEREWKTNKGDTLLIDIFSLLSNLVEKKEISISKVLKELFPQLPYAMALNYEELDTDGFTPVLKVFIPQREKQSNPIDGGWLDSQARTRIIVMRWFSELNDKNAVDVLKPMLKSEEKDERDYSLIVLKKLTQYF